MAIEDDLHAAREQELAQARVERDAATMRATVGLAFVAMGGKPAAIDYVVLRAGDAFVVEGSSVKAKPGQFSSVHPGEPLPLEEWLLQQSHGALSYTFLPSAGGGAR